MRTYGSVRGAISDGRPYRDSDPFDGGFDLRFSLGNSGTVLLIGVENRRRGSQPTTTCQDGQ